MPRGGEYVPFGDRVYFFPSDGGLMVVNDASTGQPMSPGAFQSCLDEEKDEVTADDPSAQGGDQQ